MPKITLVIPEGIGATKKAQIEAANAKRLTGKTLSKSEKHLLYKYLVVPDKPEPIKGVVEVIENPTDTLATVMSQFENTPDTTQKSPDAVGADIEALVKTQCESNNSQPDNITPAIPTNVFLPGTRVFTMHDNKPLQTLVDEVQISIHKESSVVLYWCNVSDQEHGVRRKYFSQEDLFPEFDELLDSLTFNIESVGV